MSMDQSKKRDLYTNGHVQPVSQGQTMSIFRLIEPIQTADAKRDASRGRH